MAKDRTIQLLSPLGGFHDDFALQSQPPYTTPGSLNVRPRDVIEHRLRVGPRPCLEAINTSVGAEYWDGAGTAKVDGMLAVTRLNLSAFRRVRSEFEDGIGPEWEGLSFVNNGTYPPPIAELGTLRAGPGGDIRTLAYVKPNDFDATESYGIFVEMDFSDPWENVDVYLGAKMNDTAPSLGQTLTFNGGITALIEHLDLDTDGDLDIRTTVYMRNAGGSTVTGNLTQTVVQIPADQIPARVEISLVIFNTPSGGQKAVVFWGDRQVLEVAGVENVGSGTRLGFGLYGEGSNPAVASAAGVLYHTLDTPITSASLVALSNGLPRVKTAQGNAVVAATPTPSGLRTTIGSRRRMLQMWDRVLIADYDTTPAYETNDGRITSSSTSPTPAPGPAYIYNSTNLSVNWTTPVGVAANVVEVFDPLGSVPSRVYPIVAAGTIEGGTINAIQIDSNLRALQTGVCSFRIWRCPQVYYPASGAYRKWIADPGKGSIPIGCHLIALFMGSVVLADKNGVYGSRTGNPNDWDYFAASDDLNRAWFLQASQAGLIGDEIVAIIPGRDDYMLIGGRNSMYVLRGHPNAGGVVTPIDKSLGIIGPDAWCYGPAGEIVYLTTNGLYAIAPGSWVPQALTRTPPEELRRTTNEDVQMAYCSRHNGFLVFFSPASTSDPNPVTHWWVDLDNRGYWKQTLRQKHAPQCLCTFNEIDGWIATSYFGESRVMLGGADSVTRRFNRFLTTDDQNNATAVAAHVVIGPFMLGDGAELTGIIKFLQGIMARSVSPFVVGSATWKVYVGETAEQVVRSANADSGSVASGTFAAGRSTTQPCRAAGNYAAIRVSGTGVVWAIEAINARLRVQGAFR